MPVFKYTSKLFGNISLPYTKHFIFIISQNPSDITNKMCIYQVESFLCHISHCQVPCLITASYVSLPGYKLCTVTRMYSFLHLFYKGHVVEWKNCILDATRYNPQYKCQHIYIRRWHVCLFCWGGSASCVFVLEWSF